ncbi:MAG: PPOX class F420-dependent oxidoreductase, partial [Rhodococcus sp. (in: high G+C Gram-positive bacteria)]
MALLGRCASGEPPLPLSPGMRGALLVRLASVDT